jgi:phosphatidate cytidylyltransferase
LLRTRTITAFALVPIVIWVVFAGGWWFQSAMSLAALLAGWEYGRMMRAGEFRPATSFILALIALILLDVIFPRWGLFRPGLTILVASALFWQLFQTTAKTPPVDWALTVAGGLYIGLGMAHLLALRRLENGLVWTWLAVLCTWGADTFAYLVGRTLGRHPFWPRHSPGKTWEGFVGGIVGGLTAATVVAGLSDLAWFHALVIGLLVPVVAPLGDLAISMMKRFAGIKDTSRILPGHGGMLDRIDSLLAVAIFVFYYIVWIVT